jgi:cellulose synthase/poly-beta-1,6-N-acetylglucosamine synthase-like glycosyltransferase
MNLLLGIIVTLLSLYVGVSTIYLLILAVAYFLAKEKSASISVTQNYFAIIVPAHNESLLIADLCESLIQVDYPIDRYKIYIVADNCSDDTADIIRRFPVTVLERNDFQNQGKGQALNWALQKIDLNQYDAVFIVDADNFVDNKILTELNKMINSGEKAIQCHNAVGNREDSGFTQLLFVSRTIGNNLYHHAKYKLGLSSYLMGNGICFTTELLKRKGWTAFSIAEDWEYYAQLVRDGIKIAFAISAKVFHQESKGLNQATTQRLRWSSGRFRVAKTLGIGLLKDGLKSNNWWLIDAALPLLFPNYSLLLNLTAIGLVISYILPEIFLAFYLKNTFFIIIVVQLLLFLIGSIIAGSPLKIGKALLFAPIFLVWKFTIDLLTFTNIYKTKKWIRTDRHKSTKAK